MREGGIIKLCTLEDISQPGLMPEEKLVCHCAPFFSKVTTGVTRRYAALGANRNYNAVIRCWNTDAGIADVVQYAVDEDGVQYRIDVANPVYDADAIDLTLVRLEEFYDVAIEA